MAALVLIKALEWKRAHHDARCGVGDESDVENGFELQKF